MVAQFERPEMFRQILVASVHSSSGTILRGTVFFFDELGPHRMTFRVCGLRMR